jgi:hypothetical protein
VSDTRAVALQSIAADSIFFFFFLSPHAPCCDCRNIVHRHEPPVTSTPVKIIMHDSEREFIVVNKPGSIVQSFICTFIHRGDGYTDRVLFILLLFSMMEFFFLF